MDYHDKDYHLACIADGQEMDVKKWVEMCHKNDVRTEFIVWTLHSENFMSEKDLRLFAVWCARKSIELAENPLPLFSMLCNVVEQYANGLIGYESMENVRKEAEGCYSKCYKSYASVCRCAASDTYVEQTTYHASRSGVTYEYQLVELLKRLSC